MNMSERQKEIEKNKWEGNTYVHSLKYSGGIIVIIKSHLQNYLAEASYVPDERGITLRSSSLDKDINTFLYFIYAPATNAEANEFWSKFKTNLNSKTNIKNKHYFIRDLNIHMDKDQFWSKKYS